MDTKKPSSLFSLLFYAPIWLVFICFSRIGNQAEPFGLALLFALAYAGLNPWLCGACYFLSSLFFWEWTTILSYLLQGIVLAACFALPKRPYEGVPGKDGRNLVLPFLGLIATFAIFCYLPTFYAYPLPFASSFLADVWAQKAILCLSVLLLSVLFSVAAHALLHKFLKCRLRVEEVLFSALLYLLTGVGFCRFFSVNAYLGVAFFVLLLFFYVTKDTTGILLAFVLGLPAAICGGEGIERFFILGVTLTLFCHTGKWGLCFSLLLALTGFAYLDGALYPLSVLTAQKLLISGVPCLLFLLLPKGLIDRLENELIFYREKHLSRITVNLGRAATGGQLFELSALFREIQTTFTALNDDSGEQNACAFIVNTVWQDCCRECDYYKNCHARGMKRELQKLVETGCQKGRVSLIDTSDALAHTCERQSDLLHFVNCQLTDFRRFMTEAENAASGRELLASQARGVSEILKNVALEQSQPLQIQTQAEKALSIAFLKAGIVCTEILLYGEEEDFTLSLITYGKTSVQRLAAVAKYVLKTPVIISKKLPLSRDKCCFILRKRPIFDAAFGVATLTKAGEKACGDTYTVVKIDERRFIVALADGMGSGEYAQKISACTLSLLESFYRTKMPPDLILSTINKLLSFSKEETFTCVDIAVVDLDSGKTDLIKIGAPAAYVVGEKNIHVLESNSLPLGILDSLRPNCATHLLKNNDVLLFVSDGISDALGSAADACDLLKNASIANPQTLADFILESALKKYGGVAKDDMTVVAVRLFQPLPEESVPA